VTVSELKRWLKKRGCTFTEGAKHTKVVLAGRVTRMPRHPSQEVKAKTLHTILRDLGLNI
jgi:mRNA interferase HicA